MTMMSKTNEFQYQSMRSQYTKINTPPYDFLDAAGGDEKDDDDDALSFCDLPIYNDASADSLRRGIITADYQDHKKTNNNSDSDRFEFFSAEFSSAPLTPDNIIFCGRLIPSSGDSPPSQFPNQKIVTKLNKHSSSSRTSPSRKYGIFKWFIPNSYSLLPHHHTSTKPAAARTPVNKKAKDQDIEENQMKKRTNRNRNRNRNIKSTESSQGKLSSSSSARKPPLSSTKSIPVMSSCSGFGIIRLPSEMNLDEIKSRQGRRSPRSYLELYEEEEQRRSNKLERRSSTAAMTPRSFVGMMRSFSCRACRTF